MFSGTEPVADQIIFERKEDQDQEINRSGNAITDGIYQSIVRT